MTPATYPPPAPDSAPDGRTSLVDVSVPGRAPDAFDLLRRGWDDQVGTTIPIPPSRPVGGGDYRIRIRHSEVADAVVEDIYSEAIVGGTGGRFNHLNGRVVLHVVHGGTWDFTRAGGRGGTVVAPAGRFVARYNDPPWEFGIGPRTTSQVLILPAAELRPHLGDGHVDGPTDAPALRLLLAYLDTLDSVLDSLSPGGVRAARGALLELAKGVLTEGVDGDEPRFAHALVRAARQLADERLADPGLAPRVLAAELNISVRTLHRVFAGDGESVMAYVRRRRLERALGDLASSPSRLSVSEAAARWSFSDGSHLIRACRRAYGLPPAAYAQELRTGQAPRAGDGDRP
ncbi:helix-turn-helix domain-containing protein [Streptomyces liangshanensis]|uniref:Helix-turn-helix domain-containing protein n=1 Tax=Streptomyces liangshanensis TaxID=2717324 RepID=A0A6G9GUI7_9ACTN|nr:helix-turn-helix domain-containing protein [Streptomyces liangshanensis]QIQ01933.1 helix-turn-helix domain-containing protein [Streptomyces liangshanensis]